MPSNIFATAAIRSAQWADTMRVQNTGFQSPSQAAQTANVAIPNDSKGHWAETWIKDMIRYGVMNVEPDGNFYPDDSINRATYAMAVQRLLVVATRDESLETKYFGEPQSRFSDVPSSHFAYNAMALTFQITFTFVTSEL